MMTQIKDTILQLLHLRSIIFLEILRHSVLRNMWTFTDMIYCSWSSKHISFGIEECGLC